MREYIENKFGIYVNKLDRKYRYIGFKHEPGWNSTEVLMLGFWWFHIFYDTGKFYDEF